MPFFLIIAFVFFIAIDILIFFRMWNFVIVGLVFGAVLIILGLILRIFTPDEEESDEPSPVSEGSISKNTQVMGQPAVRSDEDSPALSFGVVLFIIEAVAVLGLLLYLFLR